MLAPLETEYEFKGCRMMIYKVIAISMRQKNSLFSELVVGRDHVKVST